MKYVVRIDTLKSPCYYMGSLRSVKFNKRFPMITTHREDAKQFDSYLEAAYEGEEYLSNDIFVIEAL